MALSNTLSHFTNIIEICRFFNTEEKCKQALREARWGDDDVVCPYCGAHHCGSRRDGRFFCKECDRTFSVKVGTIFENTKISLQKWFLALYIVSSHRKGISSPQLAKDISVTQKTAWFMMHKIRQAMRQDDDVVLGTLVQCDEMYYGGRETNKHESKKQKGMQGGKGKYPIFGIAESRGWAYATPVESASWSEISKIIEKHVKEGSTVCTDESSIYNRLSALGFVHAVVNHSAKIFSRNGITTNAIEGLWSEIRRSLYGIHHWVSDKYLRRNVDESVYRYNTRSYGQDDIFADLFCKAIGVVRYSQVEANSEKISKGEAMRIFFENKAKKIA